MSDPDDDNSLEDLYTDAMLNRKLRPHRKVADPSLRDALDATAKRMRELYTLPENWEARRGIALIDKGTKTFIGNFREYVHRTIPSTRKLLREHQPIAIDATEELDGYFGEHFATKHYGISWEREVEAVADLWMDELMVGCPAVRLLIKLRLGALVRVELQADTQFASVNGAALLRLPAGTDVLDQISVDSRTGVRRQVSG